MVGGQLKLSNRRKAEVEAELEDEGYDRLPSQKKAVAQVRGRRRARVGRGGAGGMGRARGRAGPQAPRQAAADPAPAQLQPAAADCRPWPRPPQSAAAPEEEEEVKGASYEYLLGMPLSSLTLEKVQALQKVSSACDV